MDINVLIKIIFLNLINILILKFISYYFEIIKVSN